MKISPRDADQFALKPNAKVIAVLVYGPDGGLVRERMNALMRSVLDDMHDPFRISDLSEAEIKSDPARLIDEAAAIAMLGGRRVVRVRGAGDNLTKVFDAFLKDPKGDALIIVEGGDLAARSSLRSLFENEANAAAIACYADTGAGLGETIRKRLAADHLTAEPAALHYLISHLGSDRGVTNNELEKLSLYMGPATAVQKKQVTLDDVRACVGDNVEDGLDAVVDAATGGDLVALDVALARSRSADVSPIALLNALSRHLVQLHLAMESLENGSTPEMVVGAMRPMVHFTRKPKLQRQLTLWSRRRLDRALAIVAEADAQCKTTHLPERAICGQTLMRIAQAANAARR
ncbi:MAG: DNA polymerase III subunit delta [Parvibaculum sp.]|nr:DNA polymerase III subunit delta [Parvibaculum sp.]